MRMGARGTELAIWAYGEGSIEYEWTTGTLLADSRSPDIINRSGPHLGIHGYPCSFSDAARFAS